MKKIDISEYILIKPESIQKINGNKTLIDIEVEDDNTFFIKGENNLILSHNCDGSSIVGLLINFLFKYWPELFQLGLVFMAKTPIVVCKNIKNKNKISFYSQAEFGEWEKSITHKEWEIKYKKGLAALVDDEYKEIIQNPKLAKLDYDITSEENLNIWFGKDAELRKKQILC